MIRRDFMRSALTLGAISGTGLSLGTANPCGGQEDLEAKVSRRGGRPGMDRGSL